MSKVETRKGVIQCTAGAIPVKNEKGQIFMQKVKVQRYVAGKRPDFAPGSSSESGSEVENEEKNHYFPQRTVVKAFETEDDVKPVVEFTEEDLQDPRIRRILEAKKEKQIEEDLDEVKRIEKHRRRRAEVLSEDEADDESDEKSDHENAGDLDEEQLTARRNALRSINLRLQEEQEANLELANTLMKNEIVEDIAMEEAEELEYSEEEYVSSEEETTARLKPVFVRKKDRVTLLDKAKQERIAEEEDLERKRNLDERRTDTLKIVESEIKREIAEARLIEDALAALDSDEGQGDAIFEQAEYEKWKVRELKRIRRDREARENNQAEKQEIERIRKLTESERLDEFKNNPKKITNYAEKGKYKFLQKYYHRGAFFVQDLEEDVYKRDFSQPTLEDKFDKSKLPAVMQVKNFGIAGRTKYTHLVDQDTTQIDSAWSNLNPKLQSAHGGGFKNVFEKPKLSKTK